MELEKIQNILLASSLNELAAIIIHEDMESEDIIGWRNEASGSFSVSSAYDLVTEYTRLVDAAKWNAI